MERIPLVIVGFIQMNTGVSITGIAGKLAQDYPTRGLTLMGYIIIGAVIAVSGILGMSANKTWKDVTYLIGSAVSSTAATAMIWMSASAIQIYNSAPTDDQQEVFHLHIGLDSPCLQYIFLHCKFSWN